MKKVAFIILSIASIALILHCGQSKSSDVLVPIAKSDKQRILSPNVSSSDRMAQVEGNNAFAFDMLNKLSTKGGNIFFSPYSLSSALDMLYGGARNNTEKQMAQVLHFVLPQGQLHPLFNELDLKLASRGQGMKGADGGDFRLNIANALWGQVDYPLNPAYLDLLAQNYGAGIFTLDFANDNANACKTINTWVEDKTEGRIKDLLSGVGKDTALVLTNTIYFNAAWLYPFQVAATHDEVFHADNGDLNVPMMSGSLKISYALDADWKAVEPPYDGNELSMLIIVPEAGKRGAIQQNLPKVTKDILAQLEHGTVMLKLPKLELGTKYEMNEYFKELGMAEVFENPDFSGISDSDQSLKVTQIVHQAFVKMNEEGTEAAAATGISMDAGAAATPVQIDVNRPFFFFIRDNETQSILFVGSIEAPK